MSRPLLVLRPEPGAAATMAAAAAMGLAATARPLFAIRPRAWAPPDPDDFDAVLMTSANAARLGGNGLAVLTRLPLFAVGARTAGAAAEAGFGHIEYGNGDVAALIPRIIASGARRILHLAGAERTDADFGALAVSVATLYAAEPIAPSPDLSDAAHHVVLLHSPRAASLFATLAPDREATAIAAISNATLAAAGGGWRAQAVAAQPNEAALLAAAARLCHCPGLDDAGMRDGE